jgi:all-trans-retinol 13,14-reductase
LQWASLGPVYDTFDFPDLHIDFPDSRETFADNLTRAFPGEAAAVARYFSEVKAVGDAMRGYYLSRLAPAAWAPVLDRTVARRAHAYLHQRTADVLARVTPNERLRTVLAAQWGYYGSPPSRSSFAIHALVAKHFMFGAAYPVGGSKRIAETLMHTIAGAGGWTRISAPVEEILVRHGRAIGVRVEGGEEILATAVITAQRLLPAPARDAVWTRSIAALRPSSAHVCLNLGFNGDIAALGAGAANQWFYESWSTEIEAWDVADANAQAPVLYTSFPSLKDPVHRGEMHTGEIVTFVPYDAFARWAQARWMRRGADYEAFKADLSARLLAQFFRHRPALAAKLVYHELSTPLSTEHFTRAPRGAIYGIEPTPERYANRYLRPRTPVRGLYLAGSDMASVGVMGAFVGGLLAAASAEPRAALRYLRSI